MQITVEVKNVYGVINVYPTCHVGDTFAAIAGTKTLTDQTRALMKQLGYTFTQKSKELAL